MSKELNALMNRPVIVLEPHITAPVKNPPVPEPHIPAPVKDPGAPEPHIPAPVKDPGVPEPHIPAPVKPDPAPAPPPHRHQYHPAAVKDARFTGRITVSADGDGEIYVRLEEPVDSL